MKYAIAALALACAGVASVAAQEAATQPQTDQEWMAWMPDEAEIAMPALAFEETGGDRSNYDKYYIFHRPDTDFQTALGDLRTCDESARGLRRGNYFPDSSQTATNMMQYGPIGGAVGGLIAGAMMDAIFGSGEMRAKRRVNMRRCMFYLGYSRFGLQKDLWTAFNFEGGIEEPERQRLLAQQARVASGPRPQGEELGL
ncbi:hypothetical protein [Aurantiacibacter poecillastricola]|uniref:hypothetical protein n=1 Tax=Aurantiacibacter poecillastricola TaxID=3064385 RepID=UPI00273E27CD|nr:hypothetical protein [Aurantiacibacter sp. 219JJ12-13]MDP5262809.1 hypothetical protein [Aurantiacibacter sp. 219JJ12-13]